LSPKTWKLLTFIAKGRFLNPKGKFGSSTDQEAALNMSRMLKHLISASLVAITASAPFAAHAAGTDAPKVVWQTGNGTATNVPAQSLDASEGNIPAALQRWRMLSQSGNYAFSEYASFLLTYPNWPGADDMRKNAEQAIDLNGYSPNQAVAFFDRLPPLTNGGRAKYALALAAIGDKPRAEEWARKAWREGALTDDDQARLQSLIGGKLSSADHDARVDRLLWSNATRAAAPLIPLTSAARRPVLEARLAYKLKSPDAESKFQAAGKAALADPGLLLDRASALRSAGNSWSAREMLANRSALSVPPASAKEWLKTLLSYAQGAATDGNYETAYRIASKAQDSLPAGRNMSDEDLTTRDHFTSLTWLAGTSALKRLGRPSDAVDMFRLYSTGAKSPQTRSKGLYWAGKAAQAAGDTALATRYYTEAASYFDYFHGQLALEALGQSLPAVPNGPALPQLAKNSVPPTFNAARLSSGLPGWKDSNAFMRSLSLAAKSETDFANLFSWSKAIERPDLSVIAARNARMEGHSSMIRYGYPTVSVPSGYEGGWTMIHAITRQESQFDRSAVSHAGARGLMQLMPGTARETAGKIALSYRPEALTTDVQYNVQLGSTYFQRMLTYFGGSYPLAVAAYNAGPGNVNKWLAANGDPRSGSISMLDWIEAIPIFETRNYVQRVLENAVMYDHLNPDKAKMRSAKPLSAYLGQRTAG
jgi:soluble lytic murein transglycosylase